MMANYSAGSASLQRPSRVRHVILALACGISFVLYLHRYAWGFIKEDLQREYGWDPVDLGWLDGLFALSYGMGQIPSGMLCDWFGAHVLLGASVLAWSAALYAVTLASTVASMAVVRLTFGAAQASCYPVLNKVSKNWFPLGMRTTAQAWIATFFGRGGGAFSFFLIGTVLLGWLELDWRTALGVLALVGFLWGLLFFVLFRNSPRQHPFTNEAEVELITRDDPEAAVASGSVLYWPALLGRASFWFLLLRAFASNLADVLFVYWLPMYLTQIKGLPREHAGWMAALPLVGGALGGLASGMVQSRLIRRTRNLRLARSGVGFSCKLVASILMIGSLGLDHVDVAGWGVDSGLALACVFLLVKFFTDMEQPVEWGAVSDLAGRNSATVFACVNTVGAVGGFLAGPLTGWVLYALSENGRPTPAGWNMVFVIIALEYLLAALCWLFIDTRRPLPARPTA